MYAVMIQKDVTPESRTWAEWQGENFVQHTTIAGAEKALAQVAREMGVPDDKDPGAYAGLSVQKVRASIYATIED